MRKRPESSGLSTDLFKRLAFGGSYGAVDHTYRIGKFDVTTAQYTQFLNAVAKDDTYDLYNIAMAVDPTHTAPAGILRTGSPGSYVYSIDTTSPSTLPHDNYPVNNVSWGDTLRFINWLHNGQPTGAQVAGTTERGAYILDGAITGPAFAGVTRSAGALYWLPNEDEWYKAAYYKGGGTAAGYWDFATQSSTAPGNTITPATPNNANYFADGSFDYPSPIDYLTPVGTFGASPSAYGTFDQTGNVAQWLETAGPLTTARVIRGGFYGSSVSDLSAATRTGNDPTTEYFAYTFRIATAVPEPASAVLLAVSAALLFRRSARR